MKPETLALGNVEDRVPEYEHAERDVLRRLDPSEHNMERLNARARGSGRTYHAVMVEGPLLHTAFELAVDRLVDRHPLLRVRIVRNRDGALCFAATHGNRADETSRIPVSYVAVDDLAAWPSLVEADMNAGATASERGPLFAFALLEPRSLTDGATGKRVIVFAGHHSTSDARSSVALLHELLQELAAPQSAAPLQDQPLIDPFVLDVPVPEFAALATAARAALREHEPVRRRADSESTGTALEALEQKLLATKDAAGRLPAALKPVHGLIATLAEARCPAAGLSPDVDLGPSAMRYERARTAFVFRQLDRESTLALLRLSKEQGLTLHGVLCAALLTGLAARHAEQAAGAGSLSTTPEHFALASAVSLREQLVPKLPAYHLRMAIDIAISRTRWTECRFWELAARAGADVTRSVRRARALSSYVRTERRDFDVSPPGVALPLLSNVGPAGLATEYGSLRVLEVAGAMATHGSFQLVLLALTFDDRLSLSFYCETPTLSRTSLERFSACVLDVLGRVAGGENPHVSTLMRVAQPSAAGVLDR